MIKRAPSTFHLVFIMLGALLVLFVVAPLVRLVLATPAADLAAARADAELWNSIWLTLRAAGIATVISVFFGVPLAYLLARSRFKGKALIQGIVDLPIMVPHSAAGIALLTVIGRHSLMQKAVKPIGLEFVGEEAGIIVAMAFVSLPFLVGAAREGFSAVPERLERVGRTLGASPWRVFFTVTLPMSWRAVLAGMVLMWGRGISEFGAVIIIAYHPMTTPVLVYQRFSDYGLSYSRTAAVALLLVCLAAFFLLRLVSQIPAGEQNDARA
jgi:molybdate/tungstate transport system permease protein